MNRHLPSVASFLIVSTLLVAHPEGTKQINPDVNHQYYIHIRNSSSLRGCFGTKACSDLNTRILFDIKEPGERVFFGAKLLNTYPSTYGYEIKKTDGTLVASGNLPKTAGNPGFIATFAQAVAGPVNIDPAGYEPLSISAPDSGTYIFDFNIGTSTSEFPVEFFDLTITNAASELQEGRLYSYAWNFTTHHDSVKFKGKMYPYTADSVVTEIDFNGMQPYAFSVSCNLTGCFNTNNFILDRRSVAGNHTYPQYRVFLNEPDEAIFPSGTMGQIDSIAVENDCSGLANIFIYANKPGLADVQLDIDPTPGFQITDRLLTGNIDAGVANLFVWDGLDGAGNPVPSSTPVTITVTFVNGRTNLPLFDVEYSQQASVPQSEWWQGFIVDMVRPAGPRPEVFWCDTLVYNYTPAGNFPPESLELTGCLEPQGCHDWGFDVGNERTINTWWYSLTSSQAPVTITYRRNDFVVNPVHLCDGDSALVMGNWVSSAGTWGDTTINSMNCDSITHFVVSIHPNPVVDLGADQQLCQGESTTLGGTIAGVINYLWNTIPPQAVPVATTPQFTTNQSNTLRIEVSTPFGCTDADTIQVMAAPVIPSNAIRHF